MSVSRWVRRRSRRPEWALLALASVAVGCEGDLEAKRVLGRIDRMRDAPIEERAPFIAQLAELSPTGAQAMTARRTCLEAYEKLQAAHDEVNAVSERIAKLQAKGEKPRFEEIAAADEATTLMREAKAAEPACAAAVAALRRATR